MPKQVDSDYNDKNPEVDYYYENGLLVMTEYFHLKRGYCCGNKCKHCPYGHLNVQSE